MKAKKAVMSCKLTKKNRIYLERLGLIDGRTGKTSKTTLMKPSDFMNRCITFVCETKKSVRNDFGTGDELAEAWIEFQQYELQKEVKRLNDDIVHLNKMRPSRIELEKALETGTSRAILS